MNDPNSDTNNNTSTNDAGSVSKSCPMQNENISIVPVRYAIDDMDMMSGCNQINPLPEKGKWQGPFTLEHSKYTLRRLRDGWLYVYDEDAKTFHEYQVSDEMLIKYDWGSNLPDKNDPVTRGSAGKKAPYLSYPSKHTLYLGFSYHRWTWRVCEHMRSNSGSRRKAMRQLNLTDYCHETSLYNHHAGYFEDLADFVADIYKGNSPKDDMFSLTCTPLTDQSNSSESSNEELGLAWLHGSSQSDDDYLTSIGFGSSTSASSSNEKVQKLEKVLEQLPLVKVKAAASVNKYKVDKEDCALFVALDDPLADLCDLTSLLAKSWAEKENVLGAEQNIHKIRMAEIVRHIATVPLPQRLLKTKELTAIENNKYIEDHPEKGLEYEEKLNKVLSEDYERYHKIQQIKNSNSPNIQDNQDILVRQIEKQYSYVDGLLTDLLENFGIEVTDKMKLQYRKLKESKIPEQVNFSEDSNSLYPFLSSLYESAEGKNEFIEIYFEEVVSAVKQLRKDPLIVGLDNEYYGDQAYFLSIASQIVLMLHNTCISDKQERDFIKLLSFESPDNLLSLAVFGLSIDVWKAFEGINPVNTEDVGGMSVKNIGDWVTIFGRIGESDAFLGDSRLLDKEWFQVLFVPVKNSINAFETVYASSASKFFNAIVDNVLFLKNPSGGAATRSLTRVANVLRILLIHMAAGGREAILKANSQFKAQLEKYKPKALLLMKDINNYNDRMSRGGSSSGKKHSSKEAKSLKSRVIALEMERPNLIESVNGNINEWVQDTKQNALDKAKLNVKELGGLGSFIALLNVFNLIVISYSYDFKNDETDSFDSADRELISTWAWTTNAIISVFRDKTWGQVVDKGILDIAVKDLDGASSKLLVRRLMTRTFAVGLTGAVAAGLEAWNCWGEMHNKANSAMGKLGYGLKFIGTAGQAGIFFAQMVSPLLVRVGARIGLNLAVGAMLASWMVIGLWIFGVAYLIGSVIFALFSLPDIASWLRQSTWGIDRNDDWTPVIEIKNLERIIYKPAVTLDRVDKKLLGVEAEELVYSYKWQLKLYVSNLFKDKIIGLNISTSLPLPIGDDDAVVDYKKYQPKLVTTSGKWTMDKDNQCPVYTINLPGTTENNVSVFLQMPSVWLDNDSVCYVTKSFHSGGNLELKSAEKVLNKPVDVNQLKVEL
ncbi:hypothetical protein OAP63_17760 [Vibrio sp.]|nr:hypothetical protein [Vibrio sp.]